MSKVGNPQQSTTSIHSLATPLFKCSPLRCSCTVPLDTAFSRDYLHWSVFYSFQRSLFVLRLRSCGFRLHRVDLPTSVSSFVGSPLYNSGLAVGVIELFIERSIRATIDRARIDTCRRWSPFWSPQLLSFDAGDITMAASGGKYRLSIDRGYLWSPRSISR